MPERKKLCGKQPQIHDSALTADNQRQKNSPQPGASPSTPKKKMRCGVCQKKTGAANSYPCRCGGSSRMDSLKPIKANSMTERREGSNWRRTIRWSLHASTIVLLNTASHLLGSDGLLVLCLIKVFYLEQILVIFVFQTWFYLRSSLIMYISIQRHFLFIKS